MTIINTIFNSAFFGFSCWSFLWVFRKNRTIVSIPVPAMDELACRLVTFMGIYHLFTVGFLFLDTTSSEAFGINISTTKRAFGPHWFGFWVFPIVYFGFTQILRFPKMRHNTGFRAVLAVSIFVVMNYEKFVIIVTSMHREYAPSVSPELTTVLVKSLILNWLTYLALFFILLFFGMKIRKPAH